jgi:hypothetical protein
MLSRSKVVHRQWLIGLGVVLLIFAISLVVLRHQFSRGKGTGGKMHSFWLESDRPGATLPAAESRITKPRDLTDRTSERVRTMLAVGEGEIGMIRISPADYEKWFDQVGPGPRPAHAWITGNVDLIDRATMVKVLEGMVREGAKANTKICDYSNAGFSGQRTNVLVTTMAKNPDSYDIKVRIITDEGQSSTAYTVPVGGALLIRSHTKDPEGVLVLVPARGATISSPE